MLLRSAFDFGQHCIYSNTTSISCCCYCSKCISSASFVLPFFPSHLMSFKMKQEFMIFFFQNNKIDMDEYSNNDILHQHKRRTRIFDSVVLVRIWISQLLQGAFKKKNINLDVCKIADFIVVLYFHKKLKMSCLVLQYLVYVADYFVMFYFFAFCCMHLWLCSFYLYHCRFYGRCLYDSCLFKLSQLVSMQPLQHFE